MAKKLEKGISMDNENSSNPTTSLKIRITAYVKTRTKYMHIDCKMTVLLLFGSGILSFEKIFGIAN